MRHRVQSLSLSVIRAFLYKRSRLRISRRSSADTQGFLFLGFTSLTGMHLSAASNNVDAKASTASSVARAEISPQSVCDNMSMNWST